MDFKIHEFSTGVNVQPLANGGWVSTGFTGRYMNQTLNPIPSEVERAIANREFAVSEGSYSDSPAIIAKNIPLDNQTEWGYAFYSVVAVVSKGTDEKGRSASFYRYFLCEPTNEDGIVAVLKWMVNHKSLHQDQKWPEFDPLHPIRLGESHSLSPAEMGQTPAKDMISGKLTILSEVPPSETYIWPAREKTCSPLILHYVAKELSVSSPVTWAYGVEAIEKPWGFKVIFPASEYAEQMIIRLLQAPPRVLTSSRVDEEGLKATIKALTGVTNVRTETLQAFFEALENDDITDEYWFEVIDNKRGARQSVSSGVVSPELTRLMTMRSLISAEGLLGRPSAKLNTIDAGYLSWVFSQEPGKQKKIIEDSLIFQGQLKDFLQTSGIEHSKFFRKLENILRQSLIAILVRDDIDVNQISWLLCTQQSIWSVMNDFLLKVLVRDLALIYKYKTDYQNLLKDKIDQVLWLDYCNFWNKLYQSVDVRVIITSRGPKKHILRCRQPNSFYWRLVQLFELMPTSPLRIEGTTHNYHKIARYFSQISKGQVRKNLFLSAFYPMEKTYCNYLGLEISRQISPDEHVKQLAQSCVNYFWSKEEVNKGQARRLMVGGAVLGLLLGMFMQGRFAIGSGIPLIGSIFSSSTATTSTPTPTPTPTPDVTTEGSISTAEALLKFVLSDGDVSNSDADSGKVKEILNNARKDGRFEKTQTSLNQIINQVANSTETDRSVVSSKLKDLFLSDVQLIKSYSDHVANFENKFDFANAIDKDDRGSESNENILIALIYAFQKEHVSFDDSDAFGYIEPKKKTEEILAPKLREKVNEAPQRKPIETPPPG